MSKIHLNLPANSFHANLSRGGWKEMDSSRGGLDIIGGRSIPVSVSYQKIDEILWPWIGDEVSVHQSIELIGSSYGHALIPLLNPSMQNWENLVGVRGDVSVTFFSEFFSPSGEKIPTDYFWVLGPQTHLYSTYNISGGGAEDVCVQSLPDDAPAINYAGKIGIIIKGFESLLGRFMAFQKNPYEGRKETEFKDPLEYFLDKVEEIGNDGKDDLIVMPIDLEAPFIGSRFGVGAWIMLFNRILIRGLKDVFVPIGPELDRLASQAVKSKRPHRTLVKWSSEEIQHKYWSKLSRINPVTRREKVLYSIASSSDIFAAWERKIAEGRGSKIILKGINPNGDNIDIPISFSQDVIEVQIAAHDAIVGEKSYVEVLESLKRDSLFIKRLLSFARRMGL